MELADDALDGLPFDDLLDGLQTTGCWGATLSGALCTPAFQPGEGHFKHKFCERCRKEGFRVPAVRVCALRPGDDLRFCNAHGRTAWTNGARLVNQTQKCTSPRLVIFEAARVPEEVAAAAAALPAEWLQRDQGSAPFLKFAVKLGTVVPVQSSGATKRRRDPDEVATGHGTLTAPLMEQQQQSANGAVGHGSAAALARMAVREADTEDVAAVARAVNEAGFRRARDEQLSVCAATHGLLDEHARAVMHRMHCDATLRALNGAVCERRLGRVLATIERGAPLLSDQLNAGDLTHLALCCTCLLDVNTWSSVVESWGAAALAGGGDGGRRAGQPSCELACLAQGLALLNVSGTVSTASSLDESCRKCVRHTADRMQHALREEGDNIKWRQFETPAGVRLKTCASGGAIFSQFEMEVSSEVDAAVESAAGGLGAEAAQLLQQIFEYEGFRLKEAFSARDCLLQFDPDAATGVGLLERFCCQLHGQMCVRQLKELRPDGCQVLVFEWDAARGEVVRRRNEESLLANLSVLKLVFDAASRCWRLSATCIESGIPQLLLSLDELFDLTVIVAGECCRRVVEPFRQIIASRHVAKYTC